MLNLNFQVSLFPTLAFGRYLTAIIFRLTTNKSPNTGNTSY
ncbi:hypothetical protein Nizo2264_1611 [Lactiplantibacillus plantarum]|nr:hypothetical protein Nizo2264_1611 [Lactiplantibacillus plantarum]